jgi:peptidylprolyl isomerase
MRALWPLLIATLTLVLACSSGGGNSPSAEQDPADSPSDRASPMTFSERPPLTISADDTLFAVIKMEQGEIRIKLRPDLALETVNSFVFLAREGYYDGVTFHRVLPGFVAQAGDPTGTGSGGPGYNLPDEFSDTPFVRGVVAMASTGAPNSAGSQFFIVYDDAPHLTSAYTAFGEVVEGMEVADAITPRNPDNVATPQPPGDVITTIAIEEG